MATTLSSRSWRSDYDFEDLENFLGSGIEEGSDSLGWQMLVNDPFHLMQDVPLGSATSVYIVHEGFLIRETTGSLHFDDVPIDAGHDATAGEEIASAGPVQDLFAWRTSSFWMPVAIASLGGGVLGSLSIILAVISNAKGSIEFTILFASVGFLLFTIPGIIVVLVLTAVRKHALCAETIRPNNVDPA